PAQRRQGARALGPRGRRRERRRRGGARRRAGAARRGRLPRRARAARRQAPRRRRAARDRGRPALPGPVSRAPVPVRGGGGARALAGARAAARAGGALPRARRRRRPPAGAAHRLERGALAAGRRGPARPGGVAARGAPGARALLLRALLPRAARGRGHGGGLDRLRRPVRGGRGDGEDLRRAVPSREEPGRGKAPPRRLRALGGGGAMSAAARRRFVSIAAAVAALLACASETGFVEVRQASPEPLAVRRIAVAPFHAVERPGAPRLPDDASPLVAGYVASAFEARGVDVVPPSDVAQG